MSVFKAADTSSGSKIIHLRDDSRHVLSEGTPCRCIKCNVRYVLPYVAGTVRDGRELLCTECYLDTVRPRSLLGGRVHIGTETASDFPSDPFLALSPFWGGL